MTNKPNILLILSDQHNAKVLRHKGHPNVKTPNLDGLWLKRSWGGEVRNISILVAIGVDQEGYRKILAVCEGAKEDKASWTAFLRHLKNRGIKGVQLIKSDKCTGLVESLGDFFPQAQRQCCVVHFYRFMWTVVPNTKDESSGRYAPSIRQKVEGRLNRNFLYNGDESLKIYSLWVYISNLINPIVS